MKITVETVVRAPLGSVWNSWNDPSAIVQWNSAHESWHTTRSEVDLCEGGRFTSRMEARDGSAGFDFEGVYTRVVPQQLIEYRMTDGREVRVEFVDREDGILVRESFDPDGEVAPELQQQGWQAILDHFRQHVESSPQHHLTAMEK